MYTWDLQSARQCVLCLMYLCMWQMLKLVPYFLEHSLGEEWKRKENWTCYGENWICHEMLLKGYLKWRISRKVKWISENKLRSYCVRLVFFVGFFFLFFLSKWSTKYPYKLPPKQIDISIAIIPGEVSPVVGNKDGSQGLKCAGVPPSSFGYLWPFLWLLCLYLLLLQTTPICESLCMVAPSY